MKRLRLLLLLLLVCAWAQASRAQAADTWVSVPLEDEHVKIEMPPSRESKIRDLDFENLKLDGRAYTATEGGIDYSVWSFVNRDYDHKNPPSVDDYLDACADLVWESLLKPLRDQLPKEPEPDAHMRYQRSLRTNKGDNGREYGLTLGDKIGLAHFYVAGPHVYVLAVRNMHTDFASIQRFLNSAGTKTGFETTKEPTQPTPASPATTASGGGIGPGRGGNMGTGDRVLPGSEPPAAGATDYSRVFNGKEATQKARIRSKPEPTYTESARKYQVLGTVVIRAVFSGAGEVTQIRVISGLPHGLTRRAVEAAKGIKFTPATKDGHNVSMWFQLEYNFNLY